MQTPEKKSYPSFTFVYYLAVIIAIGAFCCRFKIEIALIGLGTAALAFIWLVMLVSKQTKKYKQMLWDSDCACDKKADEMVKQEAYFKGVYNQVSTELANLKKYVEDNGYADLETNRKTIEAETQRHNEEIANAINSANAQFAALDEQMKQMRAEMETLSQQLEIHRNEDADISDKLIKKHKLLESTMNKISQAKQIRDRIEYAAKTWMETSLVPEACFVPDWVFDQASSLAPIAKIDVMSMGIKDLRKAYTDISKQLEKLFSAYEERYTTKTIRSVYAFAVMYMRLEFQAIMLKLRYNKLDDANHQIREMVARISSMIAEGNKSIAGTITKFIGEAEYLFLEAAKVEHLYYIRKEQQRQEQLALRQRMKEEREERLRMEEERKRIAEEERKYAIELERLQAKLAEAQAAAEKAAAEAKSEEERKAAEEAAAAAQAEVQQQISMVSANLGEVAVQKEEIAKRQNGKAGTVYVISNLGSFGEDVFKVGMTRRLQPQDRVDELGDASVPFEFDVHCFIFSEDAVALEAALHERLNECRVNKINLRKEFFRLSIDDIEKIVQETDPTAEFNRTMLAEEYRASLDGVIIRNPTEGFEDDTEDEGIEAAEEPEPVEEA